MKNLNCLILGIFQCWHVVCCVLAVIQVLAKGLRMMHRILAAATIAFATSSVAHAGLVFDTITNRSPGGISGPKSDRSAFMAASFTSAATPSFSSISFLLAADNPADGGSVQVLLAPDTGAGAATGVAGSPDGPDAKSITTINDSALPQLSTDGTKLITLFNIPNTLSQTTANNEYWVVLLPQSSSVEWAYNASGDGIRTANQASYTDVSGVYPDNAPPTKAGVFALQVVDAPEPATIGLLGAGLAGLGAFRSRKLGDA